MADDREAPPIYFGDHPHGSYWSAEVGGGSDDEPESCEVSGTVITFMPEDTVTVPLWSDEGLLPEEPEWLNRALGLSRGLVEDIAAWGRDWNADRMGETLIAAQREERRIRLDAEARLLVARLQREVPERFTVVYRP
ncbi:hypothetical protein [Nocardioides caricicola]|uniref:Uncharacterized protein n=1 Tax=Nocardioides caricicola TaxID=634770 RepID=A0ABW0N2S4_9ACTN